jgi:hypothetical protein
MFNCERFGCLVLLAAVWLSSVICDLQIFTTLCKSVETKKRPFQIYEGSQILFTMGRKFYLQKFTPPIYVIFGGLSIYRRRYRYSRILQLNYFLYFRILNALHIEIRKSKI